MNIDDIIESAQLKGRVIALNAQVETLTAEVRCLEAVIRSHERVDCLTVANLKAEVEHLTSELKMEKENEDRLVRLWQTANNEVHGQRSQIAALIDNQTRLKAEVDALMTNPTSRLLRAKQAENAVLAIENDSLKAEVERLRKAGDAMADELIQEYGREVCLKFGWFKGWNAAKEGKPSV